MDSGKLIDKFEMEMIAPACTPGAPWWSVKLHLGSDISKVFPYLNAEFNDTDYNHKAKTLIWDNGEGFRCAFRPNEIAIAPVENRETAKRISADIIDQVCDTWNRRNEIAPSFKGRAPAVSLLAILKLLPGTNCSECGCLTCMAFAAALSQKGIELEKCDHLSVENRNELLRLTG